MNIPVSNYLLPQQAAPFPKILAGLLDQLKDMPIIVPVSYTHLTLPTSDLV